MHQINYVHNSFSLWAKKRILIKWPVEWFLLCRTCWTHTHYRTLSPKVLQRAWDKVQFYECPVEFGLARMAAVWRKREQNSFAHGGGCVRRVGVRGGENAMLSHASSSNGPRTTTVTIRMCGDASAHVGSAHTLSQAGANSSSWRVDRRGPPVLGEGTSTLYREERVRCTCLAPDIWPYSHMCLRWIMPWVNFTATRVGRLFFSGVELLIREHG